MLFIPIIKCFWYFECNKFDSIAVSFILSFQNIIFVCLFKQVLDLGPEQRESNQTVLCPLIIIILISIIIIYYIIIKLLIMENHRSRNRKRNSILSCLPFEWCPLLAPIRTVQSLPLHWERVEHAIFNE